MTSKNNQRISNESIKINFDYCIFKYGMRIKDDAVSVGLQPFDLKKVTEVMESNGGYPVEMYNLEFLQDKIVESVIALIDPCVSYTCTYRHDKDLSEAQLVSPEAMWGCPEGMREQAIVSFPLYLNFLAISQGL